MAHDEALAARVREVAAARPEVIERSMFGGRAWFVGGNMACGVMRDDLVVRLDPADVDDALREAGTSPFGRPGRQPMRGWVRVDPGALASEADIARWVDAGAEYAASLPPR